MGDNRYKVHIKAGKTWVHFCYVSLDLYKEFIARKCQTHSFNWYLTEWLATDFKTTVANEFTLKAAKQSILDKYDGLHPDMLESKSHDKYGWVRLWLTEHMKEELNRGPEDNT